MDQNILNHKCTLFYDQFVITMKAFFNFLESQLDKLSSIKYYIDCRAQPQKLIKELRSGSEVKKLVKYFQSKSTNPHKLIRKLSIANLLIMNSKQFFGIIQPNLKNQLSKDEWINQKFLTPYFQFLIKCCNSKDQYLECINLLYKKGQAFQTLFYSINMLRLLFKVVQKMPFLGRYYKSKNSQVVSSAVEIIALQAQKLYVGFKHCISQILYKKEIYIKNKDDEEIMKGILLDELNHLNQEMKKLFLDKYFYPLGKGIGVKLFKPQQQDNQFQKTFKEIVSNHQNTQREKRHNQLQKTLFPGDGLVNYNFYEETLLSSKFDTTFRANQSKYKQLDQLPISEQSAQEQPSHLNKQQCDCRQTNTGTVQLKNEKKIYILY